MKLPSLNRKGFVMISVLAISLVFVMVILPLISWTSNEFSWTSRSFMSLRALNLADAGAELAVWEIIHNSAQFAGWSGLNPKTLTISSFTDNYGAVIGDITISVDNTSPENYLVSSTGFVPSASNTIIRKTVKVKVFPHALFNSAIFGYTSVTTRGNAMVDSFDSTVGPYSPLTAGANGDIGTNGLLTRMENAVIKGDLFVSPSGAISGYSSTYVIGDPYYLGNDVELVVYDMPDYFISLSSQGNYTLAGQNSYIIPPGDYRYESISVQAKASLTISSNTRIYIHNDFYIGGQATVYTGEGVELYIGGNADFAGKGIVNVSGLAGNLEIYGLNPGTSFSYTGLSDFYGTIYAPQSSLYLAGDANFYGAVVGGDVTLAGNIQFHYDESLADTGPYAGYDIAYWQED